MAFSGHETFPVREGWLHKGLRLLIDEPNLLSDEYSHDWLGVGKNMGRSIKHWLFVSGLADRDSTKRNASMRPTALANLIWTQDPYFNEPGTLWALHTNLVQPGSSAESWAWFFGHFNLTRFEKSVCVETLRRHLDVTVSKVPSANTLERDISCLLSFYSRQIPKETVDPEDAIECPFRELGLLSYFRASGYYQINQGTKSVPPEIVAYALARANEVTCPDDGFLTLPIVDAARQPGGPARAFLMTPESLFEVVSTAEAELGEQEIQIGGLAGSRTVRVRRRPALGWLEAHYRRIDQESKNAA